MRAQHVTTVQARSACKSGSIWPKAPRLFLGQLDNVIDQLLLCPKDSEI